MSTKTMISFKDNPDVRYHVSIWSLTLVQGAEVKLQQYGINNETCYIVQTSKKRRNFINKDLITNKS